MVLGFIVAYYLVKLKQFTLTSMWLPTIIFLGAIGTQHLWELFTESWKVISLSEPVIEGFELAVVIIGLFAINYGLYQTLRLMRKSKSA